MGGKRALWCLVAGCFVLNGAVASAAVPAKKHSVTVTAKKMGDEWPLTVSKGKLSCKGSAVYFTSGGVKYAVNGTARTFSKNLPEIDAIWAEDPDLAGLKKSMGPLIDRGLELC